MRLLHVVLLSGLLACQKDTDKDAKNASVDENLPMPAPPARGAAMPLPPMQPGPAPGSGQAMPPVSPTVPSVFRQDPPSTLKAAGDKALCPDCDIILVTVCSLRKDHVSVYGSDLANTPNIDRIADGGFAFTRTYAASNFTLAGLTAILTAKFGSGTGVTGWNKGLTRDMPTLPEVLGYYGYTTAAFTIDSASGFRPDYGLDRGFQHMEIYQPPPGTPDGRHIRGEALPGAAAIPMAKWLQEQNTDTPVFAMLHSRTAHFPFVVDQSHSETDSTGISRLLWESGGQPLDPSDPQAMPGMAGGNVTQGVTPGDPDPLHRKVAELGQPAVEAWKARYKEAVERMDRDLGVVLEAIEARGRVDRTALILVADHGESLYDHQELLHGDGFFDSVVNVPLLIRIPGIDGKSEPIDALTSHVDILPTILELVGATQPAGIDGHSMLPLMTGQADQIRRIALAEGGVARHDSADPPGAVFAPPWVLLRQQRGCGPGSQPPPSGDLPTCLYNLDNDPEQTQEISRANPVMVDKLLSVWRQYRTANQTDGVELNLSPAFIKELQASGYDFR